MKLPLPVGIKALASLLPKPLYLVGGYVRDALLGFTPRDADLAGDIDPGTVIAALSGTAFSVRETSRKLMTLKIISPDGEFEYTAFRTDSYSGGHSPAEVKRTADIRRDALRRDFTMNAVYLDPLTEELLDPLNGVADIEKRTVRMTREDTFTEDGLRLLRLVRQAAETGFSISPDTLTAAKSNIGALGEISPERIRDELDRILTADLRYGVKGAHARGLALSEEIGALQIILPEITAGKGVAQRRDYHAYDVFGHTLATVEACPPGVRLAALLHDCAKPYCYGINGNFHGHDVEGERIAGNILRRLRYPNNVIRETKTLIKLHMFDLKGDAKPNTVRRFIQQNAPYIDKLLLLKQADYTGGGIADGECPGVARLKAIREEMLSENVPFSVKELKISGSDLAEMGVPEPKRGALLNALLKECALINSRLSDRESQIRFIDKKLTEERNGIPGKYRL